ncbi:MAG TPA: peptidase M16, partial [Gammaproteobacteria bacterium]|nr:peptidase M16 [Gammaproteobacteria bacterium]
LMEGVLLDDSASPLQQALETTELGAAPSPLCGLDDNNKEMTFICGLEGSRVEHMQAVEDLVMDTLKKVVAEGIPQERVEAVLHQLELQQREITGGSYPYGLQLILDALPSAVHYGDPLNALNIEPVLEQLREDIRDPAFIPRLIQEQLLDNPHRVRLTLKPDAGLSARRDAAEQARLARIKAALSEEEKQQVVALAAKLEERQNRQDDESILPKVGLEDVPAQLHIAQGQQTTVKGRPTHRYEQGTNGLVYQQLVVDLPRLDDELLEILPYYTHCLAELGCGERDYLTLQALQSSVSGGVGGYTTLRGAIDNEQHTRGHFILSGKALARNHQPFNELLRDVYHDTRFDELPRIRELMAQLRASREQGITGRGHSLAMQAAGSGMSPAAALKYRLSGLQGIHAIKQLDETLDDNATLAGLAEKMAALHQTLQNAPCSQFLLIGERDSLDELQQDCESLWSAPATGGEAFHLPEKRDTVKVLWTTSTSVNFCARAYPTVPMAHPDAAPLAVLGGFLRNGFLHRVIREQGGAYGGGASHDADSACFRFYSYRDPRLAETLEDFNRAIDWLLNEKHEWRQVEEAILGVISSLDKPSSPAGEAKDAFHNALYGRTPEVRQQHRQRILGVTLEDLQRVGATYLRPELASTAVITSPQMADMADKLGLELRQV